MGEVTQGRAAADQAQRTAKVRTHMTMHWQDCAHAEPVHTHTHTKWRTKRTPVLLKQYFTIMRGLISVQNFATSLMQKSNYMTDKNTGWVSGRNDWWLICCSGKPLTCPHLASKRKYVNSSINHFVAGHKYISVCNASQAMVAKRIPLQ